MFRVKASEICDLYFFAPVLLDSIPVVRWKLLETYTKRMGMILNPDLTSVRMFRWRPEYETGVAAMDDEHRELFSAADALHRGLNEHKGREALQDALAALVRYGQTHFPSEEKLLAETDYPEVDQHKRLHEELMRQIRDLDERCRKGGVDIDRELLNFIKMWIINHILTDDQKYATYLQSIGQA